MSGAYEGVFGMAKVGAVTRFWQKLPGLQRASHAERLRR